MSDNNWIVVTKHKKKSKTKTTIKTKNHKMYNIKKKPKLNNIVKEKILKYCEIKNDDLDIFKSWQHFYIMGNIEKNNKIFRIEDDLLLLEYINKFKVYKNYKKGTEEDFKNIINKMKMTIELIYQEMKNNNLYYKKQLLQNHPLFENFEKKYLES
jgi:hypothetical protein